MLYIRRPCFPLSVCKRKWKLWASLKSRKRRMCQLSSLSTWIESVVWGHCKTKTGRLLWLEFQELIKKKKKKIGHNCCRENFSFGTRQLDVWISAYVAAWTCFPHHCSWKALCCTLRGTGKLLGAREAGDSPFAGTDSAALLMNDCPQLSGLAPFVGSFLLNMSSPCTHIFWLVVIVSLLVSGFMLGTIYHISL